MKLYRAMKADNINEHLPELGNSARQLGVRIEGEHKDVILQGKIVPDDDGGMSVSPSVEALPAHRRRQNPVWYIDSELLAQFSLTYEENRLGKHGLIKPIHNMMLSEYIAALNSTQNYWSQV